MRQEKFWVLGMKSESTRVKVSKDQIIRDLRKIGVDRGDHLGVALSLKSIGHVQGGPEAFIDALLEVVGLNGTVMMNTFTRFFPLSWTPLGYIFDWKLTPAYTGLVPETLRRRKNSIRSRHPTYSVTAIGRLAKQLTENHDENSSPFLPYSKLARVGGKYLSIGIGNRLVAIRHEAQRLAGLFDEIPFFHSVRYRTDEGKVKTFVTRDYGCVDKLPELVPILRRKGILKTGKIGMAYSILAPARELINGMTEMLKENPTLNLCDNISCLWCRELERRMTLFKDIENPKYFQKNILIRRIIASFNSFRLKKYYFLSFRNWKGNEPRERKKLKFMTLTILTMLHLTLRSRLIHERRH